MNKIFRNILILVLPYLLMVLVNESVRPTIKDSGFTKVTIYKSYKSVNTAINPALKDHNKRKHEICSFSCHNNGCSPKLLKNFESQINPLYYGLINFLYLGGSSASYGLANILLLVLSWPLVMFYFLIKTLDMQEEIRNLKM